MRSTWRPCGQEFHSGKSVGAKAFRVDDSLNCSTIVEGGALRFTPLHMSHLTCIWHVYFWLKTRRRKIVCVSDLLVIIVQSLPTHVLKCFLCRCLWGGERRWIKECFVFRKGDHSGCMWWMVWWAKRIPSSCQNQLSFSDKHVYRRYTCPEFKVFWVNKWTYLPFGCFLEGCVFGTASGLGVPLYHLCPFFCPVLMSS